jgi:hypothetical protein
MVVLKKLFSNKYNLKLGWFSFSEKLFFCFCFLLQGCARKAQEGEREAKTRAGDERQEERKRKTDAQTEIAAGNEQEDRRTG